MLKIWGRKNSINVMKVLWCAEELGLNYERIDAGMEFGVVNEDRYRHLNPNAKVPTIDDDGFVLWESNVIVRYLCARYSTGSMYPEAIPERALAEQWMDWQQTTLHPDITYIFWGKVRNSPDHQDPDKVGACVERLKGLWTMVDRQLDGRQYLLGDAITMADIPVGTAAWRWYNMDVERPSLPNVEAWHQRLKLRSGFQQHVMLPLT